MFDSVSEFCRIAYVLGRDIRDALDIDVVELEWYPVCNRGKYRQFMSRIGAL